MIDNTVHMTLGYPADARFEGDAPSRPYSDLPSRSGAPASPYPSPAPPPGYQQVHVPPDGYRPPKGYPPPGGPTGASRSRATGLQPPPPRTPLQRALPGLRRAVGDVLVEMSVRQAMAAWERRRHDPLGPHALLMLFTERPAGHPPSCELRYGCRNFFADDEPRLPHLLDQMRMVATDHLAAGRDLRTHLLNWCDDMSPGAFYAGLGVVTLDTAERSWQDVQRKAGSDLDVPGRGFAILGDGTHLLMDRRAINDLGDATITVDQPVGETSHMFRRRFDYRPGFTDPAGPDPALYDTWRCLTELHHRVMYRTPDGR